MDNHLNDEHSANKNYLQILYFASYIGIRNIYRYMLREIIKREWTKTILYLEWRVAQTQYARVENVESKMWNVMHNVQDVKDSSCVEFKMKNFSIADDVALLNRWT